MKLVDIRAPLAGFVAMGLFWGAWGALIPVVQLTTGASDASLGTALLCIALGAIPSMIAGGQLIDRFGLRLILPLSIAVFGGATLLPAIVATPVALALALLVVGMASGLMDIAMNAAVAESEQRTGGHSMQFAHGCFALVYMLAAPASGRARGEGFAPLSILAAVAITCFLLALLSRYWSVGATIRSDKAGRERPSRVLIALGVIGAVAFMAESGLQSWSALFLERLLAAPPELSSMAPAIYGLALAIGRFSGQWLSARIGSRRLLIGGAGIGVSGSLVFAMANTLTISFVGIFVAAAGVAVLAPAAMSLAGRLASPERRGAAVATVGVIAYSGFFVGPAMLGFAASAYGLRVAIGMLPLCLLLVVAIVMALRANPESS